jgi:hypothetical protein
MANSSIRCTVFGDKTWHVRRLYGVDRPPGAAFAVEHLTALFPFHACSKSDFSDTLTIADLMGIMHAETPGSIKIRTIRIRNQTYCTVTSTEA